MIRNLIIDLGGVLVSLDRNRVLENFSKNLGFENFGEFIDPYAQRGFFAQFENGDIDSAQFRELVREHCKAEGVTDQMIDENLNSFLVGVLPCKVQLLLELRKKYNMYLLSNINPIAWKECVKLFYEAQGVDIEDVFDKCYLSYKMNASKPKEEIYRKLIADSGIVPSETLFVDDSPANIETGKQLGLHSLLYDTDMDLSVVVNDALKELEGGI